MSARRILRVQSRICVGGPALNTILLSEGLDAHGYETMLVGGRLQPDEKTMAAFAEEKGVTLHHLAEMGRAVSWTSDLVALLAMMRLIRTFRPHIVHTHTAKAGAIGRLAAFLCRVPIRVHTFHGHVFHGYFPAWKTRLFIWIERFLARLSHRIVAISSAQFHDLTRVYRIVPEAKCHIVRLGFELGKMTDGRPGVFRNSLGVGPRTRLAGILARLVPIKNHQLLLHAIAHWQSLQASPPDVLFVIIGDGPLREQLEHLAQRLGIEALVVFTGWRSDIADIYCDLDLNVLVSKNEGTPVTLIEGLALGVPILTTDVGGIRDFADEDCGVIVPPDITADQLAQHLHALLSEPGGLARLPQSVSARIRAEFDVSRLVADMTDLYESLAAGRWQS